MDREDWRKRCGGKLVTPDRAVQCVRRGQRVFIGSGAAEPVALVTALTDRGSELADTEILHILTLGAAPYSEARFSDIFRHNAFFIGPNVRTAVAEGRADYTPIFLSDVPRLFRTRRLPLDVALIQVSPPDDHGFCSLGVSVDVVKSAAESADVVVAQVNPRMPRTLGDSFLHVSRIHWMTETGDDLLESVPRPIDEVALEIGRHVSRLVDHGSTLQLGIGAIPNAVLRAMTDKKDLGIHTEMFSDGVIDLIEAGVVNGRQKTLLPGKAVASFCMGTRRLYDYVHDNPFFEFRPTEFTNEPATIARNRKMVAINAALSVDLTGQVSSDSLGDRFYSGIGGQVDFIRGAARAEEGKPVIVMRSTARGGSVSRIAAALPEGAGVVTSRADVHFVVTEYGVADLWGKSVRDRALALISIAHPKFRAGLLEEARRRHLVYQDQILLPEAEYPDEWELQTSLRDGTPALLRPVRPTDEPLLKDLFYGCSDTALYERFFCVVRAAPHSRLQKLVNVDYRNEFGLVAMVREDGHERMAGIAHYSRDQATNMADAAFLVPDRYQNRGIGTLLLRHLMQVARAQGIAGFTADVLAENSRMLRVFHKSGCQLRTSLEEGAYHLEFRFDAPAS